MTTPKFSVSHRRRDAGGAIGAAPAATPHHDESSLLAVAKRHHDAGFVDAPALAASDRAAMIAYVVEHDAKYLASLTVESLSREHDTFISGMMIGAAGRARYDAEMRARHDAAKGGAK